MFAIQTTPPRVPVNPILPAPSADPWMIFHGGRYYFCESRRMRSIHIRTTCAIRDLARDPGVCVWSAPERGPNSRNVWAPELHFLDGNWFIYHAADDGRNENHRMWVLESESGDPFGPYRCRGCLDTQGWAIDGTVLSLPAGKRFFVWSGWPGCVDGRQNLYLAPMRTPWSLAGERILLTEAEHPWECVAMPICEGPQVLERDGALFIIYSASGSWTEDYCLGMLAWTGGNVANPASWRKIGPVFRKNDQVWGVGHCCFVQSPCGREDWILYHAKSERAHGWEDRCVHARQFHWTPEGFPDFGTPRLCGENGGWRDERVGRRSS